MHKAHNNTPELAGIMPSLLFLHLNTKDSLHNICILGQLTGHALQNDVGGQLIMQLACDEICFFFLLYYFIVTISANNLRIEFITIKDIEQTA